jgi:nuclear transport factor 2 (NTF2) superfamily protein
MSFAEDIRRLARRLRRRGRLLIAIEMTLVATGIAALARGIGAGTLPSVTVAVVAAGIVGAWRWRRAGDSRVTALQIAHRLDNAFPALEDSSELLLRPASGLGPLARLQRRLLGNRLAATPAATIEAQVRTSSPMQLLPSSGLAVIAILMVMLGQPGGDDAPRSPAAVRPTDNATVVLVEASVSVVPPAYTGIAPYRAEPDATVEEGATLAWQLRFDGDPGAVAIAFEDGAALATARKSAAVRTSEAWVARPALYRIETTQAGADPALRRIRVVRDQAPLLEWREPDVGVVEVAKLADKAIDLSLAARDDYGVADVQAMLTLARGSGENVRFREQSIAMERRTGEPTGGEHGLRLDLRGLGIEPGDELFVNAVARDNREPEPNVTRSATLIFRWSDQGSTATVMDGGLALDVLPEYFRSQRQIIIDTERLIADTDRVSRREFANRAQALAQDQKLLRLRYGQFLGEEMVRDIGPGGEPDSDEADHDDHDHAEDDPENAAEIDPLEYFVHDHDVAEQATLFDEETKTLLKKALTNMWDAELHLRLAEPVTALPYENAALRYLKEVQQDSRIYLRRAGFSPPPVDEKRRFGGELDELPGEDERRLETFDDDEPWRQLLAENADASATRAWFGEGRSVRFREWLATAELDEEFRLSMIESLEQLGRDPDCASCRNRLRGLALDRLGDGAYLPLGREIDHAGVEAAFRNAVDGVRR